RRALQPGGEGRVPDVCRRVVRLLARRTGHRARAGDDGRGTLRRHRHGGKRTFACEAALPAPSPPGAVRGVGRKMKERLIGTWTLVSYETDEEGGKRGKPYGDAVGRLAYDEHGNMSGQVIRPAPAPADPCHVPAPPLP